MKKNGNRGKQRKTPLKKKTPFRIYPLRERRSVILSWIVGRTIAYKVKTSSAKIKPSKIPKACCLPNALLNQDVGLTEVKEYFQKKSLGSTEKIDHAETVMNL